VLAFTVIGNPMGEYQHYAAVTTVRRRADRRFVVYQVSQSVSVSDVPDVWKGPQPRYLLERIRDGPTTKRIGSYREAGRLRARREGPPHRGMPSLAV
jgi:hypothetical protein